MLFAGAAAASGVTGIASAAAEPLAVDSWSMNIGAPIPPYSTPSKFESKVIRTIANPDRPGNNQSRTPHHLLDGTITPNGLHFIITRTGAPDIDPDKHRLVIHGLVKQPLIFSLNDLMRYPMESRVSFVECGGNSGPLWSKEPIQANVQAIHGLLSCAEWTGIRLSTILDEAGIDPRAKWIIAEGGRRDHEPERAARQGDGRRDAGLLPERRAHHAVERLSAAPALPGYEGNMNVKYLRRIKLVDAPVMAINESREYTLLLDDGKAWRFYYPMEVKSFITRPSPGMSVNGPGFYEISGLAWSGHGRIAKVEVSADGGKSWGMAALQAPCCPRR